MAPEGPMRPGEWLCHVQRCKGRKSRSAGKNEEYFHDPNFLKDLFVWRSEIYKLRHARSSSLTRDRTRTAPLPCIGSPESSPLVH